MKPKPANSCFQGNALIGKFYQDLCFMLNRFSGITSTYQKTNNLQKSPFFQFYNWIDNKSTVSALKF